MAQSVRVGLIGAGGFSKMRMLPNFQRLPDVEVTVVANRSRASAEKVAAEFEIPSVADDYQEVIESPNVDAVFIGTPPYVHHEMTLAALEAGKHVLLQTRIATSAAEAREMHQKAQEAKARGVRTMLVPPAYPEEASVIADTTSGAIALNVLNWSIHFPESRIELYGEEGTVTYRLRGDLITAARVGEEELKEMPIPPEHDSAWAVEAEFIRLIRGEIDEPSCTFWDGVKNMEYLEAAYHSAVEGRRVELPS